MKDIFTAPFVEQMRGELFVDELFVDEQMTGILLAVANLDSLGYDIADKLGNTYIKGNVSFDKEMIGGEVAVDFKNGSIVADGSMASGGGYAIKVDGKNLNLRELAGVDKLEGCRINVTADGNIALTSNVKERA